MPPDLSFFVSNFRQQRYGITTHGYEEMEADRITVALLEEAIGCDTPEIIEDYPLDPRGPSCLVLSWVSPDEAIHTVLAYWSELPILITAYRPNMEVWEGDNRTRLR